MNYKFILTLLFVLLAAQANEGQVFVIWEIVITWLVYFFNVFLFEGAFPDTTNLITLILSPFAFRAPSGAITKSQAVSPKIARFATQLSSLGSTCEAAGAAMLISGGSYSSSEVMVAEGVSSSFVFTTQSVSFYSVAILSALTATAPPPSPITEAETPTTPPEFSNATLAANITISAQATFAAQFIALIVAQLNATTSTCDTFASAVSANCSCPNATVVAALEAWQNVSAALNASASVTVANGTLLASSVTVSESISIALNLTIQVLTEQRIAAQQISTAVKQRKYSPTKECADGASKCSSQRQREFSKCKSRARKVRSGRRKKAKRAKASREKRIRKRSQNYFRSMGRGIGFFVRVIRMITVTDMFTALSLFAQYLSELQANMTLAFNAILDNSTAITAQADANLTSYIEEAATNMSVVLLTAFGAITNNTPADSNCTVFANATLALFSTFNNEVQTCQAGLDTNSTKIYANVTLQLTAFGAIYNRFARATERCAKYVCPGLSCYLRLRRSFSSSPAGLEVFKKCQEPLSLEIVNVTLALNVTVNATVTVVTTNVQQSLEAAKACVDDKINTTLAILEQLITNWESCMDPNATTTVAPTTEAATTVADTATTAAGGATPAATEAATTEAATTTTAAATTTTTPATTQAPEYYPTCVFGPFQSVMALVFNAVSSVGAPCTATGSCPSRLNIYNVNMCCCK